MKGEEFSLQEADSLQGKRVRSIQRNSIIPFGSLGQVGGVRELEDGRVGILVNWEVNPAFVMQEPIQATYSKKEAETQLEVL